jgi:hypothetical protein
MIRISFLLLLAACALISSACEKHPLKGEQSYGAGKQAELDGGGTGKPGDAPKAAGTPAPNH